MDLQDKAIFGIDLGTTYSCIAYVDEYGKPVVIPNEEGHRTTPSVVQFEGSNRIVGMEAKNNAILYPNEVVEMVKRHMGTSDWVFTYEGVDYRPEEISSYILRKLVGDAEQYLGRTIKEVVITCPAYFGIAQREAIVRAGQIAGLTVREVINEPTAAAIVYDLQYEQDQVVLVFNLGGGTFDITAIEMKGGAITVVATGGDHYLGGRNWDDAVVQYLAQEWMRETGSSDDPLDSTETLQDLWNKAENAKRTLSARKETLVPVVHAGERVGVKLTREKFDELTAGLLERTIEYTRSTIAEAGKRGFTHYDQILLVGGSTRMPQVVERLQKEFPDISQRSFEPDEAVAKGAAVYGQKLMLDMASQSVNDLDKPQVSLQIMEHVQQRVAYETGLLTALRPNFFILLGLDPDALWDVAKFDAALKAKMSEWSRQSAGVGAKAIAARKNRELIPEIRKVMGDQEQRSAEAVAARKERASALKDRIAVFEQQLRLAEAKGYLEMGEFNWLVADFKDVFSEREIRSRLKVEVRVPTGPDPKAAAVHKLDPSVIRNVEQRLEILGVPDLYQLLGMKANTSSTELCRAADQLYYEMTARQPKDAEVTAKSELAGYAKDIFQSADKRKGYDESLRQRPLDALLKQLDASMKRSTEQMLYSGQVQLFLEQAAEKGWRTDEASAKLMEHARQRKWYVEVPPVRLIPQQRCGNCQAMNDKNRMNCASCNMPLNIQCPDCGQMVPSDEAGCSTCGFPTGNAFWIDEVLTECEGLLNRGEMTIAEERLRTAERVWAPKKPDERAQKIRANRKKIQSFIQEQQRQVEQLRQMVDQRSFYAAQGFLATLPPTVSESVQYMRQIVSENIAHVQWLVKQVQLPGLNTDRRVELCLQALQICADCVEARTLLSTINNNVILGTVQGLVQGDHNTITLNFQSGVERSVIFLAPPHPPYKLVGREQLLQELKQQLFRGDNLALSALNGLPGIGKTALALALAHDPEVLERFCDGMLWAGLGHEANIFSHLSLWGTALGIPKIELEKLPSITLLTQTIHSAIGNRRMLLIIDDAWSTEAAQAFKLGGPNCAHLVTTRIPEVAENFSGRNIKVVHELSETDSLKLIEQQAPGVSAINPDEMKEIIKAVDGLPLPLILVGNYLRIQMKTGQPRRLQAALERLLQVKERLQLALPQSGLEHHPSLPERIPLSQLAVIKISDEALDEEAQYALRALSIFPSKPNSFSEEAALAVAATSTKTIDTLIDFGLLESSGSGRYMLHQTISDYGQINMLDVAAYERLVNYFIDFVQSHSADRSSLEKETGNILASVEIMLEQGMMPPGAKVFAHFIRIVRRSRTM